MSGWSPQSVWMFWKRENALAPASIGISDHPFRSLNTVRTTLYQPTLQFAFRFIHSVFCLTTGPKPPLKRFLHIVRSRASSFKWEYPLLFLRSSSSFLRLLPRRSDINRLITERSIWQNADLRQNSHVNKKDQNTASTNMASGLGTIL